ncbi:MAG: hypothetical protein R3D30_06675 [Hyphomicrobiales bacterium]
MTARLARWLGLEAKSKTAKFIVKAGGSRWTPRDLASSAREGFLKNAIVYRGAHDRRERRLGAALSVRRRQGRSMSTRCSRC